MADMYDSNTRNAIMIAILKEQVVPALGCTEPGAVAYAVSRAKELLAGKGDTVKSLDIWVDKDIMKNGMGVGIPGTSEHGIIFASALALEIGKSEYVLQALRDVTPDSIEAAKKLADSGCITLELKSDAPGLYILVEAKGESNTSRVVIEGAHTNITFESLNGEVLSSFSSDSTSQVKSDQCSDTPVSSSDIKYEIKKFSIDDMIAFVNDVSSEDIAFIKDGVDMNMAIASDGIDSGLKICNTMLELDDSIAGRAKAFTAAGSEARMSGSSLPVMSSAGSGNHGITAIIPIAVIGQHYSIDNDKIYRAVALSHLITNYIKVYLGPLSPVCGCGVAAGMGAAAGLTYLQEGTNEQIKNAINNMSAGITGMLCDGAKMGCSIKVSCAASAAIDASTLALKDIYVPNDNGILDVDPAKTMRNIARISVDGMEEADEVIVNIMLEKSTA